MICIFSCRPIPCTRLAWWRQINIFSFSGTLWVDWARRILGSSSSSHVTRSGFPRPVPAGMAAWIPCTSLPTPWKLPLLMVQVSTCTYTIAYWWKMSKFPFRKSTSSFEFLWKPFCKLEKRIQLPKDYLTLWKKNRITCSFNFNVWILDIFFYRPARCSLHKSGDLYVHDQTPSVFQPGDHDPETDVCYQLSWGPTQWLDPPPLRIIDHPHHSDLWILCKEYTDMSNYLVSFFNTFQ